MPVIGPHNVQAQPRVIRVAAYLNIIKFPVPLELKHDALGLRRAVRIGAVTGTLYLPRPNLAAIEEAFSSLLPPRVKNVEFAVPVYSQTEMDGEDSEIPWGKYFTWHPADLERTAVAAVFNALLAFPAEQNGRQLSVKDVAGTCIQSFPSWSQRLSDWVEVLASDDLNDSHPVHRAIAPRHWTSPAWIHPQGSKTRYTFVNPPISLIGSSGENALDAGLWSRAVRAANNQRDIPDIWALVRDARAAQRRRLGRRAVLDAATAAELIIERQLRTTLRRNNPDAFVERLMKSAWQVSRRIELMRSLKMWLPPKIEENLSSLRNRVVHNNAPVSKEEAKAAVDAAEQLARHYELGLLK